MNQQDRGVQRPHANVRARLRGQVCRLVPDTVSGSQRVRIELLTETMF